MKGITKNQFKAQMVNYSFQTLVCVFWMVTGIVDLIGGDTGKSTWIITILGGFLFVLNLSAIIYTWWQRKHYPLDDPAVDEAVGRNLKDGLKGMGIFSVIVGAAFLLAIVLALLLQ